MWSITFYWIPGRWGGHSLGGGGRECISVSCSESMYIQPHYTPSKALWYITHFKVGLSVLGAVEVSPRSWL